MKFYLKKLVYMITDKGTTLVGLTLDIKLLETSVQARVKGPSGMVEQFLQSSFKVSYFIFL